MSKGRRVYSFLQGMHIVLDIECSLHIGCPQITQLFLVFRCFLFWSRQTQQLPTIGVGPRLPCGARAAAAFSREVTIRCPSTISPNKMVPHQHPIVTTSFHRGHTQPIGKLFQKLSSLILCPKPCVVFSIDDVACQASDVNHVVKNASGHRSVCRFTVYSPSILSIVSTPPFCFVAIFYYLWLG